METKITTTNFNIGSLSDKDYIYNFSSISDVEQALVKHSADCSEHIDDYNDKLSDYEDELNELEEQLSQAHYDNDTALISYLEGEISDIQQNIEEVQYSLNRMEDDYNEVEQMIEQLNSIFYCMIGYNLIKNPYSLKEEQKEIHKKYMESLRERVTLEMEVTNQMEENNKKFNELINQKN